MPWKLSFKKSKKRKAKEKIFNVSESVKPNLAESPQTENGRHARQVAPGDRSEAATSHSSRKKSDKGTTPNGISTTQTEKEEDQVFKQGNCSLNNGSVVKFEVSPVNANKGTSDADEGQDSLSPQLNAKIFKKSKKSKTPTRSRSLGSLGDVLNGAISKIETMNAENRNKQFHKLFKDVPYSELLITTYSCALLKDMALILHGRLYVSPNWFCFHSNLFGKSSQVIIPVSTVTSIRRKRTALVIPNAIGIQTHSEKYVFGSLLSRRAAYKNLHKIWDENIRGGERKRMSSTQLGDDSSSKDTESDMNCVMTLNSSDSNANHIQYSNENHKRDINPYPGEDHKHRKLRSLERKKQGFVKSGEHLPPYSTEEGITGTGRNNQLAGGDQLKNIPSSHISHRFYHIAIVLLILVLLSMGAFLAYRIILLKPKLMKGYLDDRYRDEPLSEVYLRNSQVRTESVNLMQDSLLNNLDILTRVHNALTMIRDQVLAHIEWGRQIEAKIDL